MTVAVLHVLAFTCIALVISAILVIAVALCAIAWLLARLLTLLGGEAPPPAP